MKKNISQGAKEFANELLKEARDMTINIVTHEWIKEQMDSHNLTPAKISVETGLDPTIVSAYINGKRKLTIASRGIFYFYFKSLGPNRWEVDKLMERQAEAVSYAVSFRESELENAYEPIRETLQLLVDTRVKHEEIGQRSSDPDPYPNLFKTAIQVLERFNNLTEK